MSVYELAILGSASADELERLTATLSTMVADFGLSLGCEIRLHDGTSIATRNKHSACAATYFGGVPLSDVEAAKELTAASVPVIPTVTQDGDFGQSVPPCLHMSNGLRRRTEDVAMTELAVALLECVGLLRRQRRVFVSYRRAESRAAAMQLHDLMTARGFDVFLDTHSIRPGDPFQDVLWHRLCDSDVMVMLDTPTYFESKWTRREIGRARAKDIHVLRVVWPGHVPSKFTDLAETIYLDSAKLRGSDGPIDDSAADQI